MHNVESSLRGDLLDEPLFTLSLEGGDPITASLPEVLHHLWRDKVLSFDALQAHQRQPWHCFLTQLAALCFVRCGLGEDPANSQAWRDALLILCGGVVEAFQLVVEDVSKPAFMQSPIPEGSLEKAKYKDPYRWPDELDMLVTSKNHDVKMSKVTQPRFEHWIFALVTRQTMEGFLGVGNYGIARMNGGFGSRPLLGVTPEVSVSARLRRDVAMLLASRDDLLRSALSFDATGIALCWLSPWDGGKQSGLALETLDPFFIEVCRRLRFVRSGSGALACWRANTKGARLNVSKDLNGLVGDPWTPTLPDKALTLSGNGFTYKLLHDILFGGDYTLPPAMRLQKSREDGVFLIAECLVRGQGGTEGLHRREVFIPNEGKKRLFGKPSEREKLALISKSRVEAANKMRGKVLYPSLGMLSTEGKGGKPDADKLSRWTNAFEGRVDECFFPKLWDAFGLEEQESKQQWARTLKEFAHEQLEDAMQGMPISSSGYWRAVSSAQSMFHACWKKHFDHDEEHT